MKNLFVLFGCLIAFSSFAQQETFLFLGNSYTHYNTMPKLFQKIANSKGKDVFADTLAVSNSTLKMHSERPNTYRKMKSKKWDHLIIQGFSRELAQDSATIAKETIPYIHQMIDSMKKYNPCVQIHFYMTWSYKDGAPSNPDFNTYDKMIARIQQGYMQLHREFGYPVVPVGLAWKQLKQEFPSFNPYQDDNQHPNLTGSYLIASCFYSAFFKDLAVGADVPDGINKKEVTPYVQVVSSFVLANYNSFYLNMVQFPEPTASPILNFDIAEKWTSITLSNYSKEADKYVWDFGDGNKSTKKEPVHYYKESGTYNVTLIATKDCHDYTLKKKITVSNKEKFATRHPKKKK